MVNKFPYNYDAFTSSTEEQPGCISFRGCISVSLNRPNHAVPVHGLIYLLPNKVFSNTEEYTIL